LQKNDFGKIMKKFIAAAVIEKNGKILIAQRSEKAKYHPGLWEFPGGKAEAGETLQECLKRELYEELDIHAEIGEYFCTSSFNLMDSTTLRSAHHERGQEYDMCVFKVPSFHGEIKLNEHAAIAWVTPAELSNYNYPDPDLPIIKLLQE
jgi:mutator protein MutT